MGSIYVASWETILGGYHSYLVFDEDGNLFNSSDQYIIRGGSSSGIGTGTIVYEVNESSATSADGLDNVNDQPIPLHTYKMNDRDLDGVADDYTDRRYSALSTSAWTSMVANVQSLANISAGYEHDYAVAAQNSNSVTNTILNLAGINMCDTMPFGHGFDWSLYVGMTYLLDSEQSNNYTAYVNFDGTDYVRTTFLKAGGNDRITLEYDISIERNGLLEVRNENDSTGRTTVYLQGLNWAHVTFDTVGTDLHVEYDNESVLVVDNYYADRGNNSAEGDQTTAFEFEDFMYRRGSYENNTIGHVGLNKAVYITGGGGNDTLVGGNLGDTIYGDDGNDTVLGSAGNDTVYGGIGNDTLNGGNDNDTIYGEGDNDTLTGGDGDDHLYGGDGVDTLSGNNGNDKLWGGAGNDTLNGQIGATYGSDELYGEADDDIIIGGEQGDILHGGDDDDEIWGNGGNDDIDGGDDDDILWGGGGNDTLNGGDGVDTLTGGDGYDALFGGPGSDHLYGGADADDFFLTDFTTDYIHDFVSGQDRIDISDLLYAFDSLTMDIAYFVEVSSSGDSGYLRIDENGGGDSFVTVTLPPRFNPD